LARKHSRKQRKVIREKHQRAQAHGLPARALERPQPAPANWDDQYSRRRAEDEDEDEEASGSAPAAPERPPTLLERLRGLPVAAKLAAVVLLVVLVIGLVATLRRR
jgi:hypothetical protein